DPGGSGRCELRDERVQRRRADRAFTLQTGYGCVVDVVDDDLVAAAHQAAGHVRSHAAQADHPELHVAPTPPRRAQVRTDLTTAARSPGGVCSVSTAGNDAARSSEEMVRMADEFDVIVVGAGPPGENAAGRCADGGLSVAIVEERLVGGECSFYGCVPSKTLIRPGDVVAAARRVPGAAEAGTRPLDAAGALRQGAYKNHRWGRGRPGRWLSGLGGGVGPRPGRRAGHPVFPGR